jgi:hypothetical protein
MLPRVHPCSNRDTSHVPVVRLGGGYNITHHHLQSPQSTHWTLALHPHVHVLVGEGGGLPSMAMVQSAAAASPFDGSTVTHVNRRHAAQRPQLTARLTMGEVCPVPLLQVRRLTPLPSDYGYASHPHVTTLPASWARHTPLASAVTRQLSRSRSVALRGHRWLRTDASSDAQSTACRCSSAPFQVYSPAVPPRGTWVVCRAPEEQQKREKKAAAKAAAAAAKAAVAAPAAAPPASSSDAAPAVAKPASPFAASAAKPASPFAAAAPAPAANPVAGASKPAASPFAAGAPPLAKKSSPFQSSGSAASPFGAPQPPCSHYPSLCQ